MAHFGLRNTVLPRTGLTRWFMNRQLGLPRMPAPRPPMGERQSQVKQSSTCCKPLADNVLRKPTDSSPRAFSGILHEGHAKCCALSCYARRESAKWLPIPARTFNGRRDMISHANNWVRRSAVTGCLVATMAWCAAAVAQSPPVAETSPAVTPPNGTSPDILPEQPRQERQTSTAVMTAADMGLALNRRYETPGLIVGEISKHGALARAGVRLGDQIVAVNGQPVKTEAQFVRAMLTAGQGDQPARFTLRRGGQSQLLAVEASAVRQSVFTADPLFQFGALVDERSPRKLIVQRIVPRSPAYDAGIEPGDVITQVGNAPLANLDTLRRAIEQAGGDGIVLEIDHRGRSRLVTLRDIDTSLMRTAMRGGAAGATQRR